MDETPEDGADRNAPETKPERTQLWTRRRALGLIGAGGLAGASYVLLQNVLEDDGGRGRPGGASASREVRASGGDGAAATTTESADVPAGFARWSDPETWGGQVPGPRSIAVIERPVLLDVDAEVDGVRITPDGELMFDPSASRSLRTTSNVTVDGALRMMPADAETVHRLSFPGIDESAVVGSHTHTPVPTDIGMWVVGNGEVEIAGTAKTAWTRATGALRAGARRFAVADATGWRAGDEIVVTPTEPTSVDGFADHYDLRTIAAVDGTTITLERPLEHPHPEVTVRDGVTFAAEVLNLTRNVVIEGTEDGRAHILVLSSRPQRVAHATLQHMGPQTPNPESDDREPMGIEGRYALHFHMVGDGSRGSVVEGVVARDGGNHAFVSHLSNGITYTDCVAHDMAEDPFWWDLGPEDDAAGTPANDIVYERCVAHRIRHGRDKYSIAGFMIGTGEGNVARGCVAAGVMGQTESAAAYHWPQKSIDERNTWVFEDNVAHNNANSAIYFWQNNVPRTIVDRFTAYHCGQGIFAGAYSNLASYRDTTIYACAGSGLVINAVPRDNQSQGETITFEGMYVDQAGLTDYAVDITEHILDTTLETRLTGCTFTGGSRAQVGIAGSVYHQLYRFEDCRFEGNAFWLSDDVPDHTRVRVSDDQHGSIVLRRADQPGEANPDWNASVSQA